MLSLKLKILGSSALFLFLLLNSPQFVCTIGDLEVDRLLNEIDDAVKLLPYLLEKDHTASVSQEIEQAVRAYKVENAQLKRFVLFES